MVVKSLNSLIKFEDRGKEIKSQKCPEARKTYTREEPLQSSLAQTHFKGTQKHFEKEHLLNIP